MVQVRNSDPYVQLPVGHFHLNGNISNATGQSQTLPRPSVQSLSLSPWLGPPETRTRCMGCTLVFTLQIPNHPQCPVLLLTPAAPLVQGSLSDLPQPTLQWTFLPLPTILRTILDPATRGNHPKPKVDRAPLWMCDGKNS